jgi:hypothetical protein
MATVFFRAISFCLYNSEIHHQNLRKVIVDYISKNEGKFDLLVDGDFKVSVLLFFHNKWA